MHQRSHLHQSRSFGQKAADVVALSVGSWPFILSQTFILATWVIWNHFKFFGFAWDVTDLLYLNLTLSFQAAFTAPIIMISQNRQASRDRQRDDLEAAEVEQLHDWNKTQLEILEGQRTLTDDVHNLGSHVQTILRHLDR